MKNPFNSVRSWRLGDMRRFAISRFAISRFVARRLLGGLLPALLLVPSAVVADEITETIKNNFSKRIDNLPIEAVLPTPFPELYEVQIQGNIVYTNKDMDFVIFGGELYDLDQKSNLTAQSYAKINQVDIDELPLDLAIKTVYGSGQHRLVTFEDPNCIWCKRLNKDFRTMDVTVYTFVVPTLMPDSFTKARHVLCAEDSSKVWNAWMGDNVEPPQTADCEPPTNELLDLMHQLRVAGTPAIFFDNGHRINGYAPADRLLQTIAEPPLGE